METLSNLFSLTFTTGDEARKFLPPPSSFLKGLTLNSVSARNSAVTYSLSEFLNPLKPISSSLR